MSITVDRPDALTVVGPGTTLVHSELSPSSHPLCVHHHEDVTVVVYSAPHQKPARLNNPIVPSLHVILVEEGNEVEGLTEVLAEFLHYKNKNLQV